MVSMLRLSRWLATVLLVWLSVSLLLSASLTHNDRALLLQEDPYSARGGDSQSRMQSPRLLVKHRLDLAIPNTKDRNRRDARHQQRQQVQRRGRRRHETKPLPADFVLPATRQATICATKDRFQCIARPCRDNSTLSPQESWHYGHGLVHRDNDLRGNAMRTSGQANAGSGCAVSVKYKFIYIHVLKSAGMTIKAFLKRALCGGQTGSAACQDDSTSLEIVDCAAVLQEHPDYFVWSFVRNPFARLYSGYSMADNFRLRTHGSSTTATSSMLPEFTFDEFATSPRRNRLTMASVSHFEPQTKFLFDRADCPVFDFLGRLEDLENDMQQVLELIGSPELKAYYVQANNGTLHHETSTAFGKAKIDDLGGDLRNAYRSVQTVESATHEYARDFALLGYDPNIIPTKQR